MSSGAQERGLGWWGRRLAGGWGGGVHGGAGDRRSALLSPEPLPWGCPGERGWCWGPHSGQGSWGPRLGVRLLEVRRNCPQGVGPVGLTPRGTASAHSGSLPLSPSCLRGVGSGQLGLEPCPRGVGAPGLEGAHCADGGQRSRGSSWPGQSWAQTRGLLTRQPCAPLLSRWPRGGVQTQAQVSGTHLRRGPGRRGPLRAGGKVCGRAWQAHARGHTSRFGGQTEAGPAGHPGVTCPAAPPARPPVCTQLPRTDPWADRRRRHPGPPVSGQGPHRRAPRLRGHSVGPATGSPTSP